MKRFIILLVLLFGLATSANALMFDPTGLGNLDDAIKFDTFDWAPSSALSVGANELGVGDTFTLLTMGRLTELQFQGSEVWDTPIGTELTFVAGFTEKITSSVYDAENHTSTQGFELTTGGINFFNVYLDNDASTKYDASLVGDGTAGKGFSEGTLLFSGSIIGGTGSFESDFSDVGLLDPLGNDGASNNANFSGNNVIQQSVTGTGGTTIYSSVAFSDFNENYFPDIDQDAVLWMIFSTNTNNNMPFAQIDPSNLFDTVGDGSNYYNAVTGAINGMPGYGPDVLFQMDASTSVRGVVPEPTTFLLFGIGLIGFAGLGRRKQA